MSLALAELGWTVAESPRATSQPNLRAWTFKRNVEIPELHGLERPDDRLMTQRGELSRWWDQPLTPGGPMQIASARTLTTTAGRTIEVQTTSIFAGVPRTLDVVFLQGADWYARLLFEDTFREDVDIAVVSLRFV